MMPRYSEWALDVAARDYATRYPACLSRIMNAYSYIVVEGVWVDVNQVPADRAVVYWLLGHVTVRDPRGWDACSCSDAFVGAARRRLGPDEQLHTCADPGDDAYDEDLDRALRRCVCQWIVELLSDVEGRVLALEVEDRLADVRW